MGRDSKGVILHDVPRDGGVDIGVIEHIKLAAMGEATPLTQYPGKRRQICEDTDKGRGCNRPGSQCGVRFRNVSLLQITKAKARIPTPGHGVNGRNGCKK